MYDNSEPPDVWQARVTEFTGQFQRESWGLYGLATVIVLLRFISKFRKFGIFGLRSDDYLMAFCFTCFTLQVYGENRLLARGARSNYMPADAVQYLTPTDRAVIIDNGIWMFTNQHTMLATLWSAKFCMLIIYGRITEGLNHRRIITAAACYVGLAFIGTELGLLFSCFPVQKRWGIPGSTYNCSFYLHHQIIDAVFGLSSSILILLIGLPIIISVRLPPRQKYIITVLFALGIFDIVAGCLTKVFVLNVQIYGFMFIAWYIRECTVAILVCNLPLVWSFIGDVIPGLKDWTSRANDEPNFWGKGNKRSWRSCWKASNTTTVPSILASQGHISQGSTPGNDIDRVDSKDDSFHTKLQCENMDAYTSVSRADDSNNPNETSLDLEKGDGSTKKHTVWLTYRDPLSGSLTPLAAGDFQQHCECCKNHAQDVLWEEDEDEGSSPTSSERTQ